MHDTVCDIFCLYGFIKCKCLAQRQREGQIDRQRTGQAFKSCTKLAVD